MACFIKTLRENLRDWKILILAVVFAPFFIYMYYAYMGNGRQASYNIVLVSEERAGRFTEELITEWERLRDDDGRQFLNILSVTDQAVAREMIKNREADLFITVPEGFTDSLQMYLTGISPVPPAIHSYGDQSNIRYMTATSLADYAIFSLIRSVTGITIPVHISYSHAGQGKSHNEFDIYVPALLILSLIMILFTSGASIVREIEKDTITRLALSGLRPAGFITALSLNQVIIGLICLMLTYLAALSVGFHSSGSIPLLLLVGAVTCLSVVSISIIVSGFIRSMFGLLTLGTFPFFILVFFSDCFMPLPRIDLFRLAGQQVYLNDILPTATAARAFNKILNFDAGLKDVLFETAWIAALSMVYYFISLRLFRRRQGY